MNAVPDLPGPWWVDALIAGSVDLSEVFLQLADTRLWTGFRAQATWHSVAVQRARLCACSG